MSWQIFFPLHLSLGFPGGPVVKHLPCKAGDTDLGRFYMPVSHNYWASALEPMLYNKRGHHNEKLLHRN